MFIRQKINKSGTVSVQIIDRSRGRYKLVKTIGCSMDPLKLDRLADQANAELLRLSQPLDINFNQVQEKEMDGFTSAGEKKVRLVGPELILGKLFDQTGFNTIKDEFFRHLVLSRLCYPVSKLKAITYLNHSQKVTISADRIFLYLERLDDMQKERVQDICVTHAKKTWKKALKEVYCYVSPLHSDHGEPEDLKINGAVKESKNHFPHHLFGLFVTANGDPLAFELFEGNKLQGQSIVQATENFKAKFRTKRLVVIADSGLFSDEQAVDWQDKECEYLLGARLKSEDLSLQAEIAALKLKNGQCREITIDPDTRLLVSYSKEQAEKEKSNHRKGLEKLKHLLKAGLLSRKNINNRGYNKYLKTTGKAGVGIDYKKFRQDNKLDGLTGILTNTKFSKEQMDEQFDQLYRIGKAFRISHAELHAGSLVQQPSARLEAHFSIALASYKIYKELERTLNSLNVQWSADQAIGIAKSIFEIETRISQSGGKETHLQLQNEEQRELLRLFGM